MTLTTEARTPALLLPDHPPLQGPATRSAMTRTAIAYLVLWLCGLVPLAVGASETARAVGLGLALPGGGLFYAGHPVWGAITILGFVVAIFLWWSMGPIVAPPLVWLGTAVVPFALTVGEPATSTGIAVLVVVPALAAVGLAVHAARHRAQVREGARLNALLRDVSFSIGGRPDLETGYPVVEHDERDLRRLRHSLDLALQPLEAYDGFTHIDQFREGALRYQLNALGYGLAMSQFTRTPAFGGYLAEAQRNAVEKVLQRKVWGYWGLENAWGNLRFDRDPVANDENVMLTGFYGLQVGMYSVLNDTRYSEPGSLTFQWDERTNYPSSLPDLSDSIARNVAGSAYSLFPCEPNWIYTICNTFGLNTVTVEGQLRPSPAAGEVATRLLAAYQREFMRPDGKIIGVRSGHLGLSWNFWASQAVQLATTYWMHPGLPDLSHRSWWLLRENWLQLSGGRITTPRGLGSRLDPGNYKIGSDTFTLAVTTMAARELGDEEYAVAAEATLADRERIEVEHGAERYADASGLANSYLNLGLFGRASGLRDLVAYGPPTAWGSGPRLENAAYPDVLVARAVTDGTALDLVLRPGSGAVRTVLELSRLVPGRTYLLEGAVEETTVADAQGRALVEVALEGRTEVRGRPLP
ncbi:TM2 domain-containing membrane protein YozV [Marmoricola sp. OAE513]|uniref:linalool dehydratase/isomerase domain-containing protein n=1 Tax=Marmoricola sp. OAE513 TaxID=2817894 RepID=UPI001AEAFFA2